MTLFSKLLYSSRNQTVIFMTIVAQILFSCSDDEVIPKPDDHEFLVDATLISTPTAAEIKFLAQFSGLGLDINEFKYDVDLYKITYHTMFRGSEVMGSGLVGLPKTDDAVGMLSFQHGTIVKQDEAPSNLSATDPNTLLYGSLASSGFIGVVPDFLGFGASSAILHPYYVEEYTASAVIDMLKAARELADENNVQFNERLFLAGYSEGGYATMATHKAIEQHDLVGFELIASFAGAGAYDIKEMQSYMFDLVSYDDPYYLAYIAIAYQLTFDFSSILTDFFKEPYASAIPSLFDGSKSAGEINAQLTTTIGDLIQEGIVANIDTDPTYAYLVDAFDENSLTDWVPTVRLYLYHGESDTTVPFENSEVTYTKLIDNGASSDVISLTPLAGTHSTALEPYLVDFVTKLWDLR
jgi:pimeloyl-ACP methyl ester carboxylesterase